MVDEARVRALLGLLGDYRVRLKELSALPDESYLDQQVFAGRYLIQVAAQACIDLAAHVIRSEAWRVPSDYADTFSVLAEHDVIKKDLARRLQALAGLRNRLVHAYPELDDVLVLRSIREGLEDLDDFARAVAGLLS